MGDLIYRPPLLASVDIVPGPERFAKLNLDERTEGKFVLYADGDEVKLYGLLWMGRDHDTFIENAIGHKDILTILRSISEPLDLIGLTLGGGNISMDHANYRMILSGSSMRFGACPRGLLERYVGASMYTGDVRAPARARIPEDAHPGLAQWYKDRGFDA